MLTVLGGLAEYERHLILTRTAEGRTRAKANGSVAIPCLRHISERKHYVGAQRVRRWSRSPGGFNVSHMTIARLMA